MSQVRRTFLLSVEELHQNTNVGDDYEILSLLTEVWKCLCIINTRVIKVGAKGLGRPRGCATC